MHRGLFPEQPALNHLPQAPAPAVNPGSFVVLPVAAIGVVWLYQLAFEQAQAVARPGLPERDLLGVWN